MDKFLIGKNVVTVELHGSTADIWISGPTASGKVKFLGHTLTEILAGESTEDLASWANASMSHRSSASDGVQNADAVEVKKERLLPIVIEHLESHRYLQDFTVLGKKSMKLEAAFEYRLLRSFGYRTPSALMRDIHNVPYSTIARRLSSARDSGLLQKITA